MNFGIDTNLIQNTSIHYWHTSTLFLFAHWKSIVLGSAIFTPLLIYWSQRSFHTKNDLSQQALQIQGAAFQEQLEVARHAQGEQQVILMDLLRMKRDIATENMKYKLKLYQEILVPISDLINRLLFLCESSPPGNPNELFERFHPIRLQTLSRLALFAPEDVFERFQDLLNYTFLLMQGDELYSLEQLTEYTVLALNSIRSDIGIAEGELAVENFGIPENLLIDSLKTHHTIWRNLRPVSVNASRN